MSGEILDRGPENLPLFSARLKPHRSLDQRGFRMLLGIFTGASFFSTLPFVLLGAWPVVGFMGIDVALFYFAFRASFRAARAYEDVEVTFFELFLTKVSATGERMEWRFNPAFVRLEQEREERPWRSRLFSDRQTRQISLMAFLAHWPRRGAARGFLDV
jgi:uncharacterized membrane protein